MKNVSVLVISDSHGEVPALTAVLDWACREQHNAFAAAAFLGDGAEDLPDASAQAGFTVPWYKVRGNGDLNLSIPNSLLLEIPMEGGVTRKFFLTHGNRYNVDAGGQTLAAAAKDSGAEAALFGHIHIPHCSVVNGIFLLNPGSIGRSRSDAGPTFAVLDCPAKGPLSARFYNLARQNRKIVVRELYI